MSKRYAIKAVSSRTWRLVRALAILAMFVLAAMLQWLDWSSSMRLTEIDPTWSRAYESNFLLLLAAEHVGFATALALAKLTVVAGLIVWAWSWWSSDDRPDALVATLLMSVVVFYGRVVISNNSLAF